MVRPWPLLLLLCACSDPAASPAPAAPEPATTTPSATTEAVPEHEAGNHEEPAEGSPAETSETPAEAVDAFLGEPDATRLTALRTESVADAERGRGGRSLGFKLRLADGTVGYFKPEQSFSGAHWYSEIAAYHLDRELGFGRVAPTTGRRLAWAPLRRAARADARIEEVRVNADGTVRGALIGWIAGGLHALDLPDGWERWIRVQAVLPVTPYLRPAQVRAELRRDLSAPAGEGIVPDPDRPERPLELSDLIVFDYLTSNVDRWGGGFTNVRVRDTDGALVYLDNGAGFWPNARLGLMDRRLHALQKFRRSSVGALEAFDLDHFRQRLATDPLAPVIDEPLVRGVEERRLEVLRHVHELTERFGADAVLLDD